MRVTVVQADLFGQEVAQVERPPAPVGRALRWLDGLDPMECRPQAKRDALRLMGIRYEGSRFLAAWRDAMMAETGMSRQQLREQIDWEVNVLGNRGLGRFIWALA